MEPPTSVRFSIRDVTRDTGVPAHTLRFWEKALDPLLRPFRTPGGQRRYDETHLRIIRDVRHRVQDERQSLAAVRRDLLRHDARHQGQAFSNRLLEDPVIQQALDDVAKAVKDRVVHLLDGLAPQPETVATPHAPTLAHRADPQ